MAAVGVDSAIDSLLFFGPGEVTGTVSTEEGLGWGGGRGASTQLIRIGMIT
jgi:hypothetical protein